MKRCTAGYNGRVHGSAANAPTSDTVRLLAVCMLDADSEAKIRCTPLNLPGADLIVVLARSRRHNPHVYASC